jgi:uncharacterized repeat protein (TIGR03847 family)
MSDQFELQEVQVFAAGALGQPGQRTFFLQARGSGLVVTLKCEKQQVEGLAHYLDRLLEDLPDPDDVVHPSLLELAEPVLPSWVLGSIGVAYDNENDRVVLFFEEMVLEDDDDADINEPFDDEEKGTLRLRLTRGQARSFCDVSTSVVSAGRPPCRFCGLPLDPRGHACFRMN